MESIDVVSHRSMLMDTTAARRSLIDITAVSDELEIDEDGAARKRGELCRIDVRRSLRDGFVMVGF